MMATATSEILFASSFDDKYSPQNVIAQGNRDFWSTTGLFPQELYIQFDRERTISSVTLATYSVKKLAFESCENDSAVNFIRQAEMEKIPFQEGRLQEFFLNFSQSQKSIKILKLIIQEGYEEFSSVHNLTFK